MKTTLNVNIGQVAFTIDEDAYDALNKYLDDVKSRVYGDTVVEDVETRIADIFSERLSTPMQVVNIDMVRQAIAVIGKPDVFGERTKEDSEKQPNVQFPRPRKLMRSRHNKMIGGVCAGMAEYFDVDASLMRVLAVIALFAGTAGFWAYVILWIVLPLEQDNLNTENNYGRN